MVDLHVMLAHVRWRSAAREGCLRREWTDIALFRLMQFWGTHRGNAQSELVSARLRETFYYPRGLGRPAAATTSGTPATRQRIDYTEADESRLDV